MPRLILPITDAGKYLDDEDMLLLMIGLSRMQLVKPFAVVANHAPELERARLVKGMLSEFDVDVPVGVGTSCGAPEEGSEHEFVNVEYMADQADLLEDGLGLMVSALDSDSVPEGEAVMLLVSGLTDMKILLTQAGDVVRRKVGNVVIMGGVHADNGQVALDEHGFMQPDSAGNNACDPDAARFVYHWLQENEVSTTILTRRAAIVAKLYREFDDKLGEIDHPVAKKMSRMRRQLIQDAWKLANLPPDHELRKGKPWRWGRQWFGNNYCDGAIPDKGADDNVWEDVSEFPCSDALALIASVPSLRDRFYDPEVVRVGDCEHWVIGVDRRKHGVKDPDELRAFMGDNILKAFSGGQSEEHE